MPPTTKKQANQMKNSSFLVFVRNYSPVCRLLRLRCRRNCFSTVIIFANTGYSRRYLPKSLPSRDIASPFINGISIRILLSRSTYLMIGICGFSFTLMEFFSAIPFSCNFAASNRSDDVFETSDTRMSISPVGKLKPHA